MSGNLPFLLRPAAKDYLWGGNRLNDDYGKGIKMNPLAETWECSTHSDGLSFIASGDNYGISLAEALQSHPQWLGTHPLKITGGKSELPILVKLIDAKSNLSVQVHPDDDYARRHENQLGKTEMWYVLAARKKAKLVYGFNQEMTPDRIQNALAEGKIEQFLNHVAVYKDDIFLIEPGIVHAIGAGVLVAEIQESSNVTYRLYDYDRVDKNGRKRPLHIEKALQVARLESSAVPRQPMRVLRYRNGSASELLTRCKYFQVERMLLNTEGRKLSDFQTGKNSFHVLLCTDGCGVLLGDMGDKFMLNFFKGDCFFIPAESIPLKLHGRAQFLNVSC